MPTRRVFLDRALKALGLTLVAGSGLSLSRMSLAASGLEVIRRGTPRESLIHKDPARLDASRLELTPLETFGTMGPTDHEVDLESWRLEIGGEVHRPLALSLAEIRALPAVEREVLQICPGVFANHGRWKGPETKRLLDLAGVGPKATHLTISGPEGSYKKTVRFPLGQALQGRLLLAYQVNGESLPRKHGRPLRLVAQGAYGYDWVKYVDRIRLEAIP